MIFCSGTTSESFAASSLTSSLAGRKRAENVWMLLVVILARLPWQKKDVTAALGIGFVVDHKLLHHRLSRAQAKSGTHVWVCTDVKVRGKDVQM